MMDVSIPMLPEPMTDETIYALSETLSRVSIAFDNIYFAQLHRHHAMLNEDSIRHPEKPWQ